MRPIGAAGHPANRTAGRWVLDVLVALIAAVAGLPEAYHSANGTAPAAEHPWGLALALFLSAAPLLVRRIWPVPVLGCVLAVSLAIAIDHHTANGLALLIALYTVATMRPRREALACAAAFELFIVAVTIWLAGSSWWYPAIFLATLLPSSCSKTTKERRSSRNRRFSKTPFTRTSSSRSEVGASPSPSMVRHRAKRSFPAVTLPSRALIPSEVTSTPL